MMCFHKFTEISKCLLQKYIHNVYIIKPILDFFYFVTFHVNTPGTMRSRTRQHMKRTLDLGCGSNKRAGAIGADITRGSAADVIVNLEQFFYPFKDNAFDHIVFSHVIEHLTDIPRVMEEIWRISAPTPVWKAPHHTFPRPHPIPIPPTAIISATAPSIFCLNHVRILPANCVDS